MWTKVKEISKTDPSLEVRRQAKNYLAILNTKDRFNHFAEIKLFIQKHTK